MRMCVFFVNNLFLFLRKQCIPLEKNVFVSFQEYWVIILFKITPYFRKSSNRILQHKFTQNITIFQSSQNIFCSFLFNLGFL